MVNFPGLLFVLFLLNAILTLWLRILLPALLWPNDPSTRPPTSSDSPETRNKQTRELAVSESRRKLQRASLCAQPEIRPHNGQFLKVPTNYAN